MQLLDWYLQYILRNDSKATTLENQNVAAGQDHISVMEPSKETLPLPASHEVGSNEENGREGIERCELFEKCKFINRFATHPRVIESGWIKSYCMNWDKSEECERKVSTITSDCNCQPSADLGPDGDYLL